MFLRQTPDIHANSHLPLHMQVRRVPLVHTILPRGLPTLCLILQSMCANEGVREDISTEAVLK